MPRIINRTSSGGTGALLGGIGQGLSNFAGAYMGREQLDQQKAQQKQMNELINKIYGGMTPVQPQVQMPQQTIQQPMQDVPPMQQNMPQSGMTRPQQLGSSIPSVMTPTIPRSASFDPVSQMIGGGQPGWLSAIMGM